MYKGQIKECQDLINSGMAWKLEGSVGRMCMYFIKEGFCTLGQVGFRDYYGNYVPSRHEVKKGYPGSASYVKRCQKERASSEF